MGDVHIRSVNVMSRPMNNENLMSLADQVVWAIETYGGKIMFEYQPPAVLNQAAPVQNTWYTILDTTANVRVYHIHVNIEDDDETLEIRLTIDGEVLTGSNACTHSVDYSIGYHCSAITGTDFLEFDTVPTHFDKYRAFLCEGLSVKFEVRKTTAAGTGNLTGIVMYGVVASAT